MKILSICMLLAFVSLPICSQDSFVTFENAMKQHEYGRAVTIASSVLKEKNNRCFDWYYKRASAYYKQGNFIYAISDCTSALFYDKTSVDAHFLRGMSKMAINDPTYIKDMEKSGEKGLTYISSNNSNNSILDNNNKVNSITSDVDIEIPQNKQIKDNTFVLIIANENYLEDNISNVKYAINDGKIFKEYCLKTFGIPESNIHYKEDATRNQMRSEIRWLNKIAEAFNSNVNLIIYYSGHGMPDEVTSKSYLLPIDGIPNDAESAYELGEFYSQLGQISANSITVFIDACFSGAQRTGGLLTAAKGVAIKPKEETVTGNVVVFSASTEDETAYPFEKKGHGLFTYYLLKKIKESRGHITMKELTNYVIQNVKQRSIIENNSLQTPTVNFSANLIYKWEKLIF